MANEEIVKLLNEALRMEHAAAIQYRSHAEMITGPYAEPIISRLQDSAADETKHAEVLCGLLGDYFFAVPALDMTAAKPGGSYVEILSTNISTEEEAIAIYQRLLALLLAERPNIFAIYEHVEHAVRHILMEEQEHVAELQRLLP